MKKIVTAFLTAAVLFSFFGCASMGDFWVSHSQMLEYKYKPRIDVWKLDDVIKNVPIEEKAWSKSWSAKQSMGYSKEREIILVTYSTLKQKTVTQTVYHKGDIFTESTSESENVTRQSGMLYTFVFDKKSEVLKYFEYYNYSADGKMYDDSCELGDKAFAPGENEEFTLAGEAPSVSAVSLEQKLKDLQTLRDKNVITEQEYKKMREKAISEFK